MERFPLEIPLSPHLRDHAFDGKNMLSAAELLHLLAASVSSRFPGLSCRESAAALFPRFLLLPPGEEKVLPVWVELESKADEAVTARLFQAFQLRSGSYARLREHVRVEFRKEGAGDFPLLSFAEAMALRGDVLEVSAERLYGELVPFGPAYRNIRGRLRLSAAGAVAELQTDLEPFPHLFPGSPLIADAAFHAACVWGQRYGGRVGFPLGFRRRKIRQFTKAGIPYFCRVLPVGREGEALLSDLWIYDGEGNFCETILGLRMADVTAGRIRPPRWILEPS